MKSIVLVLAGALLLLVVGGCGRGGDTTTVTETVETSVTYGSGNGSPISKVTKYCSSARFAEMEVAVLKASKAFEREDKAGFVTEAERALEVGAEAPPGARCAFALVGQIKGLASSSSLQLLEEAQQVEQESELTEADVERIENESR